MQPEYPVATPSVPAPPAPLAVTPQVQPGLPVAPVPEPVLATTAVDVPVPTQPEVPAQPVATKLHASDRPFVAASLDWLFRVGFAMVFIINAATALVQPDSFRKLIEGNFISHALGHTQIMLYIIVVNDFFLGLLILSGWKKKYVYAWSGAWLFIVTFMKFTSLL
jgi:hypothetical protein